MASVLSRSGYNSPMPEFIDTCKNFYRALQGSEFTRDNHWLPDVGIYRGDCSGLILQLLARFNHPRYSAEFWQDATGSARPKAWQLFDYFQRQGAGDGHYLQLAVGDLLLWRKRNPPKSGDTGHALVILAVGDYCSQTQTLMVRVLDASKRPHDHDSRQAPGVGLGDMRLSLDSDGIVNGYIWSAEEPKRARNQILWVPASRL